MVGFEPHNIEYIADEKAVYATMLITRYGKLIWRIALELFVKVSKPVRLRGCTPIDTVRFESRISVCRKLKRRQAGYIFKPFQYFTEVSRSLMAAGYSSHPIGVWSKLTATRPTPK